MCGTRPANYENPLQGGGRGLIMSLVCVSVWHTPGQLREPSAGGGRGLILSLKFCLCQCVAHARPNTRTLCGWWAGTNNVTCLCQCVAHARPTTRALCRWWAGTNIIIKILSVSVCGTRPAKYENPLRVVGGD